ncbi:hypothetical protein [Francisella adeliensis]|uniref:Uncharacterized protein n=1 Tax=Francisella adeliensis TaxID=2007306 RepID=A0A2Z4Y0Y5_9GAMM|nr:hypothetical protein [Francisella adeliensis]AXA34609.1 hypothetical protein CDH04_09465 [Francisella adeliensis]MBK2086334.1 hypothetical protein [Francisella adeliensis]MBK2096549.1 hypothetical protein [Francisella adeliensis]QIW12853.1 hypothetical protein FZC43_09475 [Francisella adeliensis]QIW14730.1 hypothetical protein FZC44_09465 [Francisella adeliensis]
MVKEVVPDCRGGRNRTADFDMYIFDGSSVDSSNKIHVDVIVEPRDFGTNDAYWTVSKSTASENAEMPYYTFLLDRESKDVTSYKLDDEDSLILEVTKSVGPTSNKATYYLKGKANFKKDSV